MTKGLHKGDVLKIVFQRNIDAAAETTTPVQAATFVLMKFPLTYIKNKLILDLLVNISQKIKFCFEAFKILNKMFLYSDETQNHFFSSILLQV